MARAPQPRQPVRSCVASQAGAWLVLALAAALPVAAAAQQQPAGAGTALPLRNLLVEVRQAEQSQTQAQGGGLDRGSVVISSDGRIEGRAGVTLNSRSQAREGGTTQQVRVLNGGRAAVRLAQALTLQWWQVAWTPQGWQPVPATAWVRTVHGFVVQPAWPGGDRPVRVEIRTEGSSAGSTDAGQVLTTVDLPLDQWVTVASSSHTAQASERGVLSSQAAQRTQQVVVELRVSAP